MFLKGVGELRAAPSPLSALEMLLVRVAYAASLPTPAEVVRSGGAGGSEKPAAPAAAVPAAAAPVAKAALELVSDKLEQPVDFKAAVELFEKNREMLIYTQLCSELRLVSFAAGRIELRIVGTLPREFTGRVAECLSQWTGQKWQVVISQEEGQPTLHEQQKAYQQQQEKELSADPLMASVLEQFPGAKLMGVQPSN
jgi:DNA polymerase-3 subunit gamma/tau